MIKKISSIKNLGVFKNYTPSTDTADFQKVNILYGWNYSGKTTISRLLASFENRSVPVNYGNCEFKITDHKNKDFNEKNISMSNKTVRVFNSDFIKKNLKWDGEHFDPILILGEEAIEAKNQLDKTKKKLSKITTVSTKRAEKISLIKETISKGLTNKAGEVKKILRLVEAFRSDHLEQFCNAVAAEPQKFILNEIFENQLIQDATASENNKLSNLEQISLNPSLTDEITETRNICAEVPSFAETIEHLKNNPSIAKWVENGLAMHLEKDNCEYCGNQISIARQETLLAHFSEDLKRHQANIQEQIEKIDKSILDIQLPNDTQIYPAFRDEFKTNADLFKTALKGFNHTLTNLRLILNKKAEEPFKQQEIHELIVDNSKELIEAIKQINEIIKKQNIKNGSFDKEKRDAILNLKNHYAAKFVLDIDLTYKNAQIKKYSDKIKKLKEKYENTSKTILYLESQLSNAQRGREQINEYILNFLGQSKIKIEVVKDTEGKEKYVLLRENTKATNLSEGEKTAISFSFFLIKLKELENINEAIVCIDDPISSLDSNHIFQTKAVLKNFFFTQQKEGAEWQLNCSQLFLSTHNFEFFSLLRKLPIAKNKNTGSCFQIRRIDKDNSIIENLPKSLKDYPSEYHFLFSEMLRFHNDKNKNEYHLLMHIPNAVRRFVELYTYSRLPGNSDSTVDQRMDILFGKERSKRIMKVLHHFSHSGNIERMMNNSDLLSDISHAVDDLMLELKTKDQMHYDALMSAAS